MRIYYCYKLNVILLLIKICYISIDAHLQSHGKFRQKRFVPPTFLIITIESKKVKFFIQVKVIFQEFYEQGDAEKEAGRVPIPMMDRTKLHLQPDSQVGFISGICIPCYGLLHRLIPETKPLLDGVQSNLERWKKLAKENEENPPTFNGEEPAVGSSIKNSDSKHLLTRTISLPNRRSNNNLDLNDDKIEQL